MGDSDHDTQSYVWCEPPSEELIALCLARIEAAAADEAQIVKEQQAIWAAEDDERWRQLNQQGVFAWDDPRFRDPKMESQISEPEVS